MQRHRIFAVKRYRLPNRHACVRPFQLKPGITAIGRRILSGIQEILLIILLILGLLILPRMIPSMRRPNKPARLTHNGLRFSGKLRLALLLSALWLFAISAIFVPWQGKWIEFLYAGVGPLILAWGAYWVIRGFGNYRRR